jgi:Tfp pilus assembly protein PilX
MSKSAQRGISLVVGLIILMLMTLAGLTAVRIAQSNNQFVGNMNNRDAVIWAADAALEEAISTVRLFKAPNAIFLNPCAGPNTKCYDVNNDSVNDVTVALVPTPACISAAPLNNKDLDIDSEEDAGCLVGESQSLGVVGTTSGASLCANSLWEVTAVATDELTQASSTIKAGYSVRVSTTNISSSCPTS